MTPVPPVANEEDRLEAKHQEHRAEIAEKLAAFTVDVHDRIDDRFRRQAWISGVTGVAAFLGLLIVVKTEFAAPALRLLFLREVDPQIQRLEEQLVTLYERNRINVLADRVVANDDAQAFDQLMELNFPDEELSLAVNAAREEIGAYVVGVLDSTSRIEHAKRSERLRDLGDSELLAVLHGAAGERWDRATAAWIAAERVGFNRLHKKEPDISDPLLRGLFTAMRTDRSIFVRAVAFWQLGSQVDEMERIARARMKEEAP